MIDTVFKRAEVSWTLERQLCAAGEVNTYENEDIVHLLWSRPAPASDAKQ